MADAPHVSENDRSYFRIDDDVILEYRLLSANEIDAQRTNSKLGRSIAPNSGELFGSCQGAISRSARTRPRGGRKT